MTSSCRREPRASGWRSHRGLRRPRTRGHETLRFSEGNLFVPVSESVRGRDVFLLQGTAFPANDNSVRAPRYANVGVRPSAPTPGRRAPTRPIASSETASVGQRGRGSPRCGPGGTGRAPRAMPTVSSWMCSRSLLEGRTGRVWEAAFQGLTYLGQHGEPCAAPVDLI